ncbi:DNA cytosine methyltransferase [Mucilaginibacter sp. L196]|uniref:DNA cytosine methyltransferase n=1 Tax=Mucilaginibacter sp. L196 TaxID=1641870 RepID=UPI00131E1335|nr:DNA cytosine methyltransferase [Mucilaginibacter sp. L196]
MPYPIIDLFAGPGGLAEGFSTLADDAGERIFKIKLSIEKEKREHETLTLRSFIRQFPLRKLPDEYYEFLKGDINIAELYNFYPTEYEEARNEAWQVTLGLTPVDEIDARIESCLDGNKEWVLIGGPPCQAYSLAGRSRVGGVHQDDHRVHLYKEYLRIIAYHQPAVFVMENVKGLLSAELDGEKIFHKIMDDLQNPSAVFPEYTSSKYRIFSLVKEHVKKDSDYLIKAEEYGLPQKRHRVILLGVRNDIDVKPGILHPMKKVDLKSVISMLPVVRSGIYREFSHSENIVKDGQLKKKREYNVLKDSYESWIKLIEVYKRELKETFNKFNYDVSVGNSHPETIGKEYTAFNGDTIPDNHPLKAWYTDERLNAILHHESRSHLTQDLKRYMFASLYTKTHHKFPRMEDYRKYGEDLIPDHENAESGKFNDRFRVQVPDEPATTITSHISKDGHYFIHFDPSQCRSLTVREAARIQTFPDNYFFCGSRTQQFHQVGNAVPPLLAFKIAKVVNDIFSSAQNENQLELWNSDNENKK